MPDNLLIVQLSSAAESTGSYNTIKGTTMLVIVLDVKP